jgi:multidrug efflux pump subunit AcrA (membrane-fusion protein)
MKLLKWVIIIGLSVSAGFVISRISSNKEAPLQDEHTEHAEQCEDEGCVDLSKKSQELIDLKTIEAKRQSLVKKIPVVGQIAQESDSISHITALNSGVVSELKANIGSVIEKDDVIGVIKSNGSDLQEIKSPISGVVIGSFAKQGDKVDSVSSICTIADLSKLNGTFDIYEKDISAVKSGQKILVRSVAYPDKAFEGEITFISPRVDKDSHTVKIRGLIQNPEYLLKLGMFVNAEIMVVSEDKYIIVPQEAVHIIDAKKVVFIKKGEEEFEAREIKVKDETKDEVAISEGVNEGEAIVIQDGFLLKSELLKSKMGAGCAE